MNDLSLLNILREYGGALALLGTIVTLLLSSKFVSKTDLSTAFVDRDANVGKALDKIDRAEDRIAALENELRHLPDRDSVHRMELSLRDLKGELKAVGEQLKPVAAISERLQEFLLEQAKR